MSGLDQALDIFRLGQYFHVAVRAQELVEGVYHDATFLTAVARAIAPLPPGPQRHRAAPFPPAEPYAAPSLRGRRVALVVTGGSGALASVVGVWRALEEAEVTPDVVSVCSGAALFGFPLAAGLSAEEAAELTVNLHPRQLCDMDWLGLAKLPLAAGRGFTGLFHGDAVEAAYRHRFGDRRLRDLDVPCYAPIWNVERNQTEYLGPRTFPDVTVARAVRMAISLPPMFQPVRGEDGRHWCDGGLVDILPVPPVLDIEPRCDTAVVVNGFYPPGLRGEDAQGWERETLSILRMASQERTCQHMALARKSLERLAGAMPVTMLEPVPYDEIRGVGFYRQFVDSSKWPEFMLAGRTTARAALAAPASQQVSA